MKHIYSILLTFLCLNTSAQLKDSFDDDDFSSNPQWNGRFNEWIVNIDQKLQSKLSSNSQTIYLTTSNTLSLNAKWHFYLQLKFDPSSSNQARIYLTTDNADLSSSLNGYFIQIGESGSADSYDLYRQSGTAVTKIIDGPAKARKNVAELAAEVEVTHTATGDWQLKTKIDDETSFSNEGQTNDLTHSTSSYFGILAKYTSTRSDLFIFDEFSITEFLTSAPVYPGKPGDVLFTELFPDPSPQIDLPSSEFVEIFNNSDSIITLKNWTYSDQSTTFSFKGRQLLPKEYLIICPVSDTASYKIYGKTLGISPWPSLNNTGDVLTIKNAEGNIIDQIAYTDEWYRDALKKEGGYTLERIESQQFCTGAQRWKASLSSEGGTPGKRNSVSTEALPATTFQISTIEVIDSLTIAVNFSTFADNSTLKMENFRINPSIPIESIQAIEPYFNRLLIHFKEQLEQSKIYELQSKNINDCFGRPLEAPYADFFLPHKIGASEILINEVLFNPYPDGVDFVEIINNSSKTFDLRDLLLGTKTSKDSIIYRRITESSLLLHPQEIKALTLNPEILKQQYRCKNEEALLKITGMPVYNDDAGSVVLKSNQLIIDRFDYSEKMHFALINNPEGVSLERIYLDKSSNSPGNFHSASSSVGYATPGYENSQSKESGASEEFNLSSQLISPDNDGQDDVLNINYNLEQPDFVSNIRIFDRNGRLIKKLANNKLLGTNGTIAWDGLDEQLQPAATGPHLLIIELFSPNGMTKKITKTIIVAQKFE